MTNSFTTYSKENGGRVLLLFLLFLLSIYEFATMGFSAFAILCISPFVILLVYVAFRWKMSTFWALIIINYIIQLKDLSIPVPMSIPDELLEMTLLAIAIIDARENPNFERAGNLMLISLLIWNCFCFLEVFNDTCNLGINITAWFSGTRLLAIQLLYIFFVFSIYISSPKKLMSYLKLWAILSLFSVIWVWKQKTFGFTSAESVWMETRGRTTHILNGGTLIRFFSTFSDAANYGCNAAATAVSFIIIGITTKIKKFRLFFLLTAFAVIWGMFQSGTRTAIFCLAVGLLTYIFLSKSIKIAVPFTSAFVIFAFILVFTNIGNSNQQIRRMRSAFNKDDASATTRDINKEAIKKYIKDAPWGLGIGMNAENVPANNKFRKLSTIPPDSEYVFIWVHTGPIGISVFLSCMVLMFLGACYVVFFKLKCPSLIGIGGGLCGAFAAIQLGAYGNQVLYQYPNGLTFFGGLAIVYILPYIEPAWNEYEKKLLLEQKEKEQLKLEKELAKRV